VSEDDTPGSLGGRPGRKIVTGDTHTGATELLRIVDLKTHFRTEAGAVRAVDGVSLLLERGKTLGVVGESGSGKTILARSIMGLLPKRNVIRHGQVLYEGVDVIGYSQADMGKIWGSEMAMVFQDPMTSLNPVMRIGKQITEPLLLHLKMDKGDARDTAIALLSSVGIPEPMQRLDEYPHQLSGGMRQRVMIAIALACGPKLLFADEPTTALDVTVQAQILNLLQQQQSDRHMAMVLVTHDLGVVAGRTDEIAVMYAGKVVEQAPTSVLFSQMKMPYTEALLNSIPKLENPSHTQLDIIGGRPPILINPPPGCRFAPRCKYAQERCTQEEPPLIEGDAPGHVYRCWYPVGTPEGDEAMATNLARGQSFTGVPVTSAPVDAPVVRPSAVGGS
jgi:peptide/nickel transport system ATP-binding protein